MSNTPMKEKYKIQFGDEWPNNSYLATGKCLNCGDRETILVRKGTLLAEVELNCRRCETAKYEVRP